MHFTQDQTGGINLVRGYTPGEVRINDIRAHRALIVAARYWVELDDIDGVQSLGLSHAERLLAIQPEIVLIGSGARQEFPERHFLDRFLDAGIGIEVMSTAAACRTYNVLMSERRAGAALLIP